jgi:hypothetical protein
VITFANMRKSKFVEEVLVEGALFHVLDCGHTHDAVNTGPAATPATEQECEQCEKLRWN